MSPCNKPLPRDDSIPKSKGAIPKIVTRKRSADKENRPKRKFEETEQYVPISKKRRISHMIEKDIERIANNKKLTQCMKHSEVSKILKAYNTQLECYKELFDHCQREARLILHLGKVLEQKRAKGCDSAEIELLKYEIIRHGNDLPSKELSEKKKRLKVMQAELEKLKKQVETS